MWEFLNNLLDKAGVVVALFALTVLAFVGIARIAWKQMERLNERLLESRNQVEIIRRQDEEKRAVMRMAFDEERIAFASERARIAAEHAAELISVAELARKEARGFGERVDLLRDRHTTQMVELVEKSTRHIERIDQSISRLGVAIDVLVRVGEGR